jgi:hypothetical protein
MQAGRPYQDRLFPFGQFHHAIACSIRVNSIVRSPVVPISINCIGRKGLSRGRPEPIEWIGVVN